MANTLQIRRGVKASLPSLAVGEFGLATDTGELFVGNTGNVQLLSEDTIDDSAGEGDTADIVSADKAWKGSIDDPKSSIVAADDDRLLVAKYTSGYASDDKLHGTYNATVTEEGVGTHTITNIGCDHDTTTAGRIGAGCIEFVASNSDYQTLPSSTDWAFGTGDFELRFRLNFNALPTTGNKMVLWDFADVGSWNYSCKFGIENSSGTYSVYMYGYNSGDCFTAGDANVTIATPSTGTWYELVINSVSGEINVWMGAAGGTLTKQGSATRDGTAFPTGAQAVHLGVEIYYPSGYLDALWDELIVRKGSVTVTTARPVATVQYGTIEKSYSKSAYKVSTDGTLGDDSDAAIPTEKAVKTYADAVAGTAQGTDATYDIQATAEGATAGNARGENSVDLQTIRSNVADVASGAKAVLSGGEDNGATDYWTTVSGGRGNLASQDYATCGGGYANISSGWFSLTGGGNLNTASSDYSTIGGGQGNEAKTNSHATVCGGKSNDATGQYSFVGGGEENDASGDYAFVPGGHYGVAYRKGSMAHAGGRFAGDGDAQYTRFIMRVATTDATVTEMVTPARWTLADEQSYAVTITIHARQDTGADHAMYKRMLIIERTGGTVALSGTVQTIGTDIESDATWDITLTADDTNKSLKVEVTGAAAHNLRWVAVIEAVEIGYSD